jgi:hypothetical protein
LPVWRGESDVKVGGAAGEKGGGEPGCRWDCSLAEHRPLSGLCGDTYSCVYRHCTVCCVCCVVLPLSLSLSMSLYCPGDCCPLCSTDYVLRSYRTTPKLPRKLGTTTTRLSHWVHSERATRNHSQLKSEANGCQADGDRRRRQCTVHSLKRKGQQHGEHNGILRRITRLKGPSASPQRLQGRCPRLSGARQVPTLTH